MRVWLTALRIARREARRAKGRSTLVLGLILLPVLALSFAAVAYDMFTLRPSEQLDRDLGRFDAEVEWVSDQPIQQDPTGWGRSVRVRDPDFRPTQEGLLAKFPPGTRLVPKVQQVVKLPTVTGTGSIDARGIDLADRAFRGMVRLVDGRVPATDTEVALSAEAIERLGVDIGGAFRMGDKDFQVVAEVEFPDSLGEHVVFRPGVLSVPNDRDAFYYADTPAPLTWADVRRLNEAGVWARSRAVVLDPPPASEVQLQSSGGDSTVVFAFGALIFGLGALEVVLLAGPAFAVGARRRRRDLALVAANGGTPAHLRRIVLADGVVLGVTAAVVGLLTGILLAFAARPLLETSVLHARAGGYRVFPLALLAVAGLSVLTGVCAALVPAFSAARQDVVAALAGRRGAGRSRRRWLVVGLSMIGIGVAVAFWGVVTIDSRVVMAGLVVGELGLVLSTPSLIGLVARLGRMLPLAPRIALRDTARNRAAAAPAISAVMAAVIGSVAIGIYAASDDARKAAMQTPFLPNGYAELTVSQGDNGETRTPLPTDQLVAAVRRTLPVQRAVEVFAVGCPPGTPAATNCWLYPELPKERRCPYDVEEAQRSKTIQRKAAKDERCNQSSQLFTGGGGAATIVDDGTALPVVSGATGEDLAAAIATLKAGGVVVSDPRLVKDGKTLLIGSQWSRQGEMRTPTELTVPGHALTTGASPMLVALSPGAVASVGMVARRNGIVAATTRMPTQAEQDAFRAAVDALEGDYLGAVERPAPREADIVLIVLAIASAVIALGAAGIATGLAAVDSRPDLATLAAIGATPGLRRRLSLSQSGVIAGLGSVLGAAAGLGAAVAVLSALNRRYLEVWPAEPNFPIVVPWWNLAVAVLVVPAVAMLSAGLLTRSRLPIERRL